MIEKAVIYNTIDGTGICPEDVFNQKKLPICVSERVDLTREQMKELFYLYDLDHIDWTNKFGNKLLDLLHNKMLEWVENDKKIEPKVKILNYNLNSKKHLPTNIK